MNHTGSFITSVTAVKVACTCKTLWLPPDRRMVRLIMELVGNRSFTLTTAYGKRSRLRRLKNGIPQWSSLAPLEHLHLWFDNHCFQKVCIRQRPGNRACWWRLTNSGMDAKQRHGNRRWIPPDREVKAQY